MALLKSINELPEDILRIMLFEFVNREVEGSWEGEHQLPESLRCVCRWWKELVDGSPELWHHINVRLGHLQVEPFVNRLRKAKRLPLTLNIYSPLARDEGAFTQVVLELYDLVKEHPWRVLSIFSPAYLTSFGIFFRHVLDNPQTCRLSSFLIERCISFHGGRPIRTLARKALQQNLTITHLAIPEEFLEPTHPLLRVVSYLRLMRGWAQPSILKVIGEASSVTTLTADFVLATRESGDSIPLRLLPRLKQLDIRDSPEFPELLLLGLDLPSIQSLKLKEIGSSVDHGNRQLRNLRASVSWLARIKSLTLDMVRISDKMLLQTLQQLSLLEYLEVISVDDVSGKTTRALSQQPTVDRGWLCPLLEEIRFGYPSGVRPRLLESDVAALVRARVRDVAPVGVITSNQPSPSRLRKVTYGYRDMVRGISRCDGI
ncbi:hypothetical protein FRB94_006974 [Tulasnella sp. JGI-2019a]|nr:hypothetical protein FRB94_006974 [Tulasnella sp. JGI-2019a]